MQEQKYSIKQWAKDDRPREKLLSKGPKSLSDSELLAILINNGNKQKSAVDLGKEVLQLGKNNLNELGRLSAKEIMRINGIGEAKAITIAAALELGRRREGSGFLENPVIQHSKDVAGFLRSVLKDLSREMLVVLYLNQANKVTHHEIVSMGGITGTVVDPRVVLKNAITEGATSIIICHNHPSGNLKPSRADELITTKLKEAGNLLDIKVLDHIIVSDHGYYSFADDGKL